MTFTLPGKGLPTEPTIIDGYPFWVLPSGRAYPVIRGGSDVPPADPPADDPPADPPADDPPPDPKDAEIAKWKAMSRKHEDRVKALTPAAKELEKLKLESATEQERAVAAAKAEGRNEVLSTVGSRLVEAEFKAACAGRLDDKQRGALLDGLDRTKFLTDDGDVDTDKVEALIEGIAGPKSDKDEKAPKFPKLGQGKRPVGDATPSVASGRDLFAERKGTKK